MGEERNCRVPLYCTNKCDIAHTIENSICQTLGNEAVGRDSTSLKILEEFREIYEERLRKIDEDTTGDGMELKLKTLTSWINDLGEQNVMLVQTVEQLEQEAADRVALLEERLKKSSHIALEYMSKLEDYDNRMLEVSEEKTQPMLLQIKTSTRLVQAQQTEEILKTRISNLQNDISGLLELIHRARCDGSWNTDGLSFLEVTYEDIFGSHHHHHHQISDRSGTVDHMQSTNNILHQKLRESLGDYHGKEQEIRLLQEQIACQKADIALKDIQIKNFTAKTQEFQGGELKEITHVVEKQAVCDVAVMTNIGPGESEQETVLLKRGNACPKTEMTDRTPVSSVNKRGVCFASPSKEDYEQQIVELEKALKEARNGTETTTKQIAENNTEMKELECQCYKISNKYRRRKTLEKVKQINAARNMLNMGMPKYFLYSDCYEQGDVLTFNDGRKKVSDLEKKLHLHGKMNESQLKVIESLQEDLKKLKLKNIDLQDEIKEVRCKTHRDCERDREEHDKIKEYRIKVHGLECKLFLTEIMTCEKNEMIQMLLYKLRSKKGIEKNERKDLNNARCSMCSMLCSNSSGIQNVIESLLVQIETLKCTVSANEKVILDQQEMIRIQQEALNMSQDEVKELQNQLKNLEKYYEDECKTEEHLVSISNLQQTIISTKYQLEEWQSRHVLQTFGNGGSKNNTLQTNYQDLVYKFNGTKKDCVFLLEQVLAIEQEMQNEDIQHNKLVDMIMNLIMNIKDLSSRYIMTEEETILDDLNSNLELKWHEPSEIFHSNESIQMKQLEKIVQTEVTSVLIEDLKKDIENSKQENSLLEIRSDPEMFKSMHLDELRKMLDARVSQGKKRRKSNCPLPMNYREAMNYCNYLECEVNKLHELLADFQYQMNTYKTEIKEQEETTDEYESMWKVANLKCKLNETSENYKMASLDCYKYQGLLVDAAEREVAQQEDFATKEKYLLEKVYQCQMENSKNLDTLHMLDEEINMLHTELSERDFQLQSTASTLRALSSDSSVLQKELQKQEMNVEKLEEQLMQSNMRLQQALSYLDEKNSLLQKLNKENRDMQGHMRKLELKVHSALTPEQYNVLEDEISNFNLNIQQLLKIQEKNNLEMREHWWWDDGWHDE